MGAGLPSGGGSSRRSKFEKRKSKSECHGPKTEEWKLIANKKGPFEVVEAIPKVAICVDEHYLSEEKSADLERLELRIIQLINGDIRSTLALRTAAS